MDTRDYRLPGSPATADLYWWGVLWSLAMSMIMVLLVGYVTDGGVLDQLVVLVIGPD